MMGWVGSGNNFRGLGSVQKFLVELDWISENGPTSNSVAESCNESVCSCVGCQAACEYLRN